MTVRDDMMHTSHPYIFPQAPVRLSEDIAAPNSSRKILFVPQFPHVYIHVHVCTNACAHVHNVYGMRPDDNLGYFLQVLPTFKYLF